MRMVVQKLIGNVALLLKLDAVAEALGFVDELGLLFCIDEGCFLQFLELVAQAVNLLKALLFIFAIVF